MSAVAFGGYWIDDWGDRPRDAAAAKEAAAEAITSWPPLIQVFQHRFMPSFPVGAGNPVLSVWQANDTIYYGNDLADYLHREFGRPGLGLDQPSWSARYPRHVPYWSEAFDLLYDEMDVRCEVLPDEMRALHKDFVRRLAMIRRNHSSQQEAASDIDALSQSTKSRFDDIVETVTADVWDSVFLDRLSRSLNGDDKGNTARK